MLAIIEKNGHLQPRLGLGEDHGNGQQTCRDPLLSGDDACRPQAVGGDQGDGCPILFAVQILGKCQPHERSAVALEVVIPDELMEFLHGSGSSECWWSEFFVLQVYLIYLSDSLLEQQSENFSFMLKKPTTSENSSVTPNRTTWIKESQHKSLLVLVTSCVLMLASYWVYLGGHRGQLIEIDRAEPLSAKYLVDVNKADWPEMIQLPGLGETLALRIIADRQEHGPFLDVDDLDRVDGIGLRTLERIRPYLMPIPKDTDWAGLELENAERVQ